ncbi:MAG: DUF1211 domain-containing protein [Bdellovibrionales bacterium]|nr:DUF1211 domain-containing protein [Bdellovibrionales bacterium]
MTKNRMEAFSDGVFAIIITIMVLEMKPPHGATFADLAPLFPVFLSYVLSFIYVGIYWNNHHHMLHSVKGVDGKVLWANNFLLFWLSLFPFATAWMGENHFETLPVALYGVPLLLAGASYSLLCRALIRHNGASSTLAQVLSRDMKARVSMFGYIAAIPLAYVHPGISLAIYVGAAVLWLVPDRRLEKALSESPAHH